MKKSLFILAIALPGFVSAQIVIPLNNVSLAVQANSSLLFPVTSINDYLEPHIISNAIQLNLCLNQKGCNVSARINYNSPPGAVPPNWLSTIFTNSTSGNVVISNSEAFLNSTNIPLFTQPSHNIGDNGPHFYSFYYALKYNPITTFMETGNYNFSITYTMSLL
jgi:hypothetical protein